jgi:hypothetical protein
VKTGPQEKLNTLGHGRGTAFNVAELKLSGTGKVSVDTGIRVNRHGVDYNGGFAKCRTTKGFETTDEESF